MNLFCFNFFCLYNNYLRNSYVSHKSLHPYTYTNHTNNTLHLTANYSAANIITIKLKGKKYDKAFLYIF